MSSLNNHVRPKTPRGELPEVDLADPELRGTTESDPVAAFREAYLKGREANEAFDKALADRRKAKATKKSH